MIITYNNRYPYFRLSADPQPVLRWQLERLLWLVEEARDEDIERVQKAYMLDVLLNSREGAEQLTQYFYDMRRLEEDA